MAINRLREKVKALPTATLLEIVETLEDKEEREEAERITYAVACATLARRLGLDARKVASSALGPAATFRAATL